MGWKDKMDISFLTGNDISGSFSMEKDESWCKGKFSFVADFGLLENMT